MENKNHWICTGGCGAVVEKPGICQATGCPRFGLPFDSCDCMDNQHYGKAIKTLGVQSPNPAQKEKK